jgi:serine/threonine protein kinase
MSPGRLKSTTGSGEASNSDVTDGQIEAEGSGTTRESPLEALADLGVEGRAEFERLRARLGLMDEHEDPKDGLPSLGRYQLERELGRGGMGVVYCAHDPELGRPVAIKLVRGLPFAVADTLRARLLREAKVLGKLTHPNVVRVYDVGSHEGEVYLAMEYVDGPTLREWQEGRKLDELLDAYVEAAMGLAAAHDVGIVHRDFKPDNVFVANDGRVLVGDFGLAGAIAPHERSLLDDLGAHRDSEPHAAVTKTGALLGTVAYMAPEQLRGEGATPKSDQFAFCVSLWEALVGQRPFQGDGQEELLAAIERGVPGASDRISKPLHRLLEQGLAANPDERHADLRALVSAIPRPRAKSMPLERVLMLVGASLVVGLLASPWIFGTSASAPQACDLAVAVTSVQQSEAWTAIRERLTTAAAYDGLDDIEAHLRRIDERASELCTSPSRDAQRQHLRLWVEDLAGLLETAEARPLPELLEDIRSIIRGRLSAPPPRPLAGMSATESSPPRSRMPSSPSSVQTTSPSSSRLPRGITVASSC